MTESQPLAVLVGVIMIGGLICALVGLYLAAVVPSPSRGKGLALAVAILMSMAILLGSAASAPSRASSALCGLASILGLAAMICFAIFIHKVSKHLGNAKLSESVVGFLIFNIALLVFFIIIAAIVAGRMSAPPYGPSPSTDFGMVLLTILAFIGIAVWLVWYLGSIRGLRNTIRDRLPPRSQ